MCPSGADSTPKASRPAAHAPCAILNGCGLKARRPIRAPRCRLPTFFFYPLREDHYGTAENALIEAMSLGLVPVVQANPAEKAIVTDGVDGVVATDPADMAARLGRLLAEPDERVRLSAAARATAHDRYQPRRSAGLLEEHYRALMGEPKTKIDFAALLGSKPADWFLSTQQRDRESGGERMFAAGGALSKGSIDHFLATFPDDPGLRALAAR